MWRSRQAIPPTARWLLPDPGEPTRFTTEPGLMSSRVRSSSSRVSVYSAPQSGQFRPKDLRASEGLGPATRLRPLRALAAIASQRDCQLCDAVGLELQLAKLVEDHAGEEVSDRLVVHPPRDSVAVQLAVPVVPPHELVVRLSLPRNHHAG